MKLCKKILILSFLILYTVGCSKKKDNNLGELLLLSFLLTPAATATSTDISETVIMNP